MQMVRCEKSGPRIFQGTPIRRSRGPPNGPAAAICKYFDKCRALMHPTVLYDNGTAWAAPRVFSNRWETSDFTFY
jgi:hypothetical protein